MKKFLLSIVFVWALVSVNAQITDAFFEHVTYSGAFGYTDWTAGWANFDPQNTVYPSTTTTIPAGDITTNTSWSSSGSPVNNAASFADSYLANSFFEPVSFVGAFGPVDWTAGWSNFDPQNKVYSVPNVTVAAGNISTNTTWTAGNTYLLNGYVYVNSGVTLTIEPGTVIRGDKANKGALIIERGGKLNAIGTSALPIVFTSNQSIGSRDYGDWGGIIICGKAKNNQSNDVLIEGGVNAYFGGQDDEDNSGTLKYVRIEFPGIAFAPNNEINGLTLGSVGSGTTIDYVQVSYSGDDSFEWFGGTVNCKHIIAHRGWDDDFDTDFGFTGMIQFAVSLRDPNIADVSGSNSFESDNDAVGSTLTPRTKPIFCNVSSFGPKATPSTTINSNYKRAMHLRRSTRTSVFNSIFAGWNTGLFIDGNNSQADADGDVLRIENTFLTGMATASYEYTTGQTWTSGGGQAATYFQLPARNNNWTLGNSDLLITNPFTLTAPNFLPTKNVYLLNGWVYVKSGAVLTIQPGTLIRGDKANKGAIIVEKGGQLIANGNANEPIIFTSNQPVGSRAGGDWGGIILCGNAVINVAGGSATIEGGVGSTYGGSNDADNSGSLQFVRIEFPGIAFVANSEINGLTMGGVGSGTAIDYIQVSYSGDDSFEWFGGKVNAKHLIAFKGIDDDFDTDFGYTGNIQFAVSLRDPNLADVSGSNGFESDNDAAGSTNTPVTHPTFSNVSIFGPLATSGTSINANYKRAMHLRRNSACSVYNSLFEGFPFGLFLDGALTQANATANTLQIENTFLSGMTTTYVSSFEQTYFENVSRSNTAYANNSSMLISDPFNLTNPNFLPSSISPVLTGSRWVKTIQGKVEYENSAATDLNLLTITCKDNAGNLISQATTNATGDYSLKAVDGVFSLTVDCTKTWGGVALSDVIRLRQALALSLTLTPLQVIATDVNESATNTLQDVITIRQKLALTNPPAWIAPNWVFEPATVSIATGDGVTIKNIKGLCSGDANGSYVPVAK
ncbi:MAG: hypothetical protein HOO86_03030 [Bacteroidales bacterium]|nr:hypothetical protein [Bacteroidales bacterium]